MTRDTGDGAAGAQRRDNDEPIFDAAAAADARHDGEQGEAAGVGNGNNNTGDGGDGGSGGGISSPRQHQPPRELQDQQREGEKQPDPLEADVGDKIRHASDVFSFPGSASDEGEEEENGRAAGDGAAAVANDESTGEEAEDGAPDKVPPFCTCRNMSIMLVQLVCGLGNGFPMGVVGVYTQLRTAGMDCARYAARGSCESVPFSDCRWYTDGPAALPQYCGWNTHTCRVQYPNAALGGDDTAAHDACLQDSACTWNYQYTECRNPVGYDTAFAGVFAGSCVLGNMFGSLIASQLITHLGIKLSFAMAGAVGTVCSIMCHVDIAHDIFWVMNGARFVLGFFGGFVTVAAPLYVSQNAHPSHRRLIGSLFQTCTTFGSLTNAILGVALGQSIRYDSESDQNVVGRMNGLVAAQTTVMVSLFVLGLVVKEKQLPHTPTAAAAVALAPAQQQPATTADERCDETGNLDDAQGTEENHTAVAATTHNAPETREYTYLEMFPQILKSILVCATFRFTGFMAVLSFAPTMVGSLGLAPLVGNIVIMIVNTSGTLFSAPLLRFVKARPVFLFGSCFISCMLLFLCGIPVYPGVASEDVTNNAGVAGIVLFIFGYELCIGPAFYVITQDLFPLSFRAKGNSIAQTWQYIFALVVTICYSIAVDSFSGGPSGNQHKGQSIVFIFFGCIGLIFFILELFFMHSYVEKDETSSAANKLTREEEKGYQQQHPAENTLHSNSGNSSSGNAVH